MSEKMTDGGPAFPTQELPQWEWPGSTGMSLRAWLAGQALVSMGTWVPHIDSDYTADPFAAPTPDQVHEAKAKWAVGQADALLRALSEGDA